MPLSYFSLALLKQPGYRISYNGGVYIAESDGYKFVFTVIILFFERSDPVRIRHLPESPYKSR